jgi:ribonuclease HI
MDSKGKRCAEPVASSIQRQTTTQRSKCWVLPSQGTFKINVDAAFDPISGDAAVGIVIRDWQGSLKLTSWRTLSHCRDAEEAEVLACLEGVHMALRWPEIPMILESDCQTVVAKFHIKGCDRSALWNVFVEMHDVGSQLCKLEVIKISRDHNNMTHELACFASRYRECQCFLLVFQSGLCPSLVRMCEHKVILVCSFCDE